MSPRARLLLASLALLLPLALVPALPAQASGDWRWPVEGELITAYRNGADPYAGGQHRGIDIAAEPGTAVLAAAAGTVRFAGVAGSSGLTVSVRTADGRYDTSYLHLSEASVHEGDVIGAGDELGASGVSGRRSSERAHLHFGVREAGSRHAYVDPLDLLAPPPAPRTAPRPAPVPVEAPVPVALVPVPLPFTAPAPERVPRPVRAPGARRVPTGRRVPAGRRVPSMRPAPSPIPGVVLAPQPATAGAAQPSLAATPALGPASAPARGRAEGPAPAAPAPRHASGPAGALDRLPEPGGAPAPGSEGPDLGWALACAGLLLAAACLGRPGDRDERRATRAKRREGLRALVRPLLGGR